MSYKTFPAISRQNNYNMLNIFGNQISITVGQFQIRWVNVHEEEKPQKKTFTHCIKFWKKMRPPQARI